MEGLTKIIVSALVGVTLAGAGAWVTWGRNAIGEAKVIELIETRSPYLEDRKAIDLNQQHIASEVEKLRLELSLQRTDVAEIKGMIKEYVERSR